MSDDPASKDPPFERRSADHLPYGVHTIVIPFTWSSPQRPRPPSQRFGGPDGVTGCPPPDYVGQGSLVAERQFAITLKDVRQTSTELALSALQTLRGSSHSLHPHDAGTAAATNAGLSTSGGTSNGGVMLVSDKVGGKDDPLYELRKDLGEETPEEDIEHHHGIDPLHVPGIPPGGGALPFGPGRLDAGSSPPASRTVSPKSSQPPPPAQPPEPAIPNTAPPAANRAEFERYQQIMRERMAKPATTDPVLSQAMNEMYRDGARVGSGSTAAAVRQERATGGTVGGRTHTQKAEGYVKFLERWLEKNPTASPGDRAAAENVLRDLRNALAGN